MVMTIILLVSGGWPLACLTAIATFTLSEIINYRRKKEIETLKTDIETIKKKLEEVQK